MIIVGLLLYGILKNESTEQKFYNKQICILKTLIILLRSPYNSSWQINRGRMNTKELMTRYTSFTVLYISQFTVDHNMLTLLNVGHPLRGENGSPVI